MKAKEILVSLDFAVALAVGVLLRLSVGPEIGSEAAADTFNLAITVLSVVFAMFFAALAIIISASDNDFVAFLGDHYISIIDSFKVTLVILLGALIVSILAFGLTYLKWAHLPQPSWIFCIVAFFFFWGVLATFMSSLDAIKIGRAHV